jgi:glycosyltransferase involved in cell wall biosynthesis
MVSNLNNFGGTERVTAVLSKDLSAYYDIRVITIWNVGEKAYDIGDIKIFNLYNEKKRFRYIFLDAAKRLAEYLDKNQVEILIVVGRNNGLLPLLTKMLMKAKLIYCEHNSLKQRRYFKRNIRVKLYNWLLDHMELSLADCIVTLTQNDLWRFRAKNVPSISIYNAIDNRLLEASSVYDIASKKIITVGRIDFQKGLEYLVEVAGKVFARHPDWEWHIWGGNGTEEYTASIRRLIVDAGLEKKLFLKGASSDIYNIYPNYAIQVMTSRYEGLPMVLLEGKAKNLPLVSFDIDSGPSDIIRDGVDGFLVPPFDTQTMADKICLLIEDVELRKRFSANARGNLDKFSKDRIMKQWVELIESM